MICKCNCGCSHIVGPGMDLCRQCHKYHRIRGPGALHFGPAASRWTLNKPSVAGGQIWTTRSDFRRGTPPRRRVPAERCRLENAGTIKAHWAMTRRSSPFHPEDPK